MIFTVFYRSQKYFNTILFSGNLRNLSFQFLSALMCQDPRYLRIGVFPEYSDILVSFLISSSSILSYFVQLTV